MSKNNSTSIFAKIWNWIKFILSWIWKITIPLLLGALLLVPIFLTYFPSAKKSSQQAQVNPVTKGDLSKKISVQATNEYTYDYDLPVYQDSELKEISVKVGDKVSEGQVLAKLDFVNEATKVRTTTAENQIKTLNQEIVNNNRSLNDNRKVADANMTQMSTNLRNRYTEYNELIQRREDKAKELADKKEKYTKEKADLEKQYAEIENIKDVNDAIRQYQDKIDVLRRQRDSTTPSNQPLATQTQVNTQRQQVDSLSTQFTTQCPNGNPAPVVSASSVAGPASSTINCNTIYSQFKTANDNLALTQQQANNANNQATSNSNDLNSQINDFQVKIDRLKNTNFYQTPVLADVKANITDQAKNTRLDTQKQEYKTDMNSRTTWIKQIDDNQEVKTYDEQILAKEKVIRDLETQQGVTKSQLDQTASGTDQKNAAAKVSLNNAQKSLADTQEDVAKQDKNKSISAKKAGMVAIIYKQEGLVAASRDNVLKIVSGEYRLKFVVSADNRSKVKTGQNVKVDKYPELDNLTISELNLAPNPTTATATALEYDVFVNLPKTDKYQFASGETSNVDVILGEQKQVLTVPTASVFDGQVYVGIDPVEQQGQTAAQQQGRGPVSLGRNGVPRINTGSLGRAGNNQPTETVKSYKFKSIKAINVEAGLDDGRNVEIKSGLNEGDFVFSIFPKVEKDKQELQDANLVK
jgi:multidrug efflux pump subunit AcrA (membrane-fusion protein)